MAYKFQLGTAKLSGSIIPTDDDAFDLGEAGKEFQNLFIDGTANVDAINLAGTDITSDAGEINLLDGSSAGTVVNSKAVIYGASGQVNGTTVSSSAELKGQSLEIEIGQDIGARAAGDFTIVFPAAAASTAIIRIA